MGIRSIFVRNYGYLANLIGLFQKNVLPGNEILDLVVLYRNYVDGGQTNQIAALGIL